MTRSKLGHAFVLVGVNLVVLLGLVVVFELSFGSWFVPYVLPNKKFNVTYTFQQTLYQPPSTITYTRDQYGLRGVHGPISSVELVTVGASTTDQLLITDGETWQDVIHEATGISVANAGIDGMSTQSQTDVLEEWLHQLPGLHPRYYLYYIGGVDTRMKPDGAVGGTAPSLPVGTAYSSALGDTAGDSANTSPVREAGRD